MENKEDTSKTAVKPRGRPITKENAKAMSMSAVAAKQARIAMRRKLLQTAIDVGIENIFARCLKTGDEKYMAVLEKGLKLVGLTHDQSDDALAQRLDIKTENNTKLDTTLKITVTDANGSPA